MNINKSKKGVKKLEGYIIFASKEKRGGLLHTTIKPTREQCYSWAKKRNLKEIIEVIEVKEFLKRGTIGKNNK